LLLGTLWRPYALDVRVYKKGTLSNWNGKSFSEMSHIYLTLITQLITKRDIPKYRLHGEIAASVLLKLFINGNTCTRCHTADAELLFSDVNNIQSIIPGLSLVRYERCRQTADHQV